MFSACKQFLSLAIVLGLVLPIASNAQSSKPVYVIVHGAWGGGWAFKKTDSLLRAKGAAVYRPTLTGQGEKVHLATLEVGLQTHINDVVNMILFENLHDIILVGHSYGGMVITGVADSLKDRIRKLIYVDAMFPSSGESALTIIGPEGADYLKKSAVNGYIPVFWAKQGDNSYPRDVPHPLKTFSDTLVLKHGPTTLPITYILTVAKGTDAAKDDFAAQAERAKKRGIKVLQLEADHNPQWSAVGPFAEMLYQNK